MAPRPSRYWNAQRCREVAVGDTAGGAFGELHAQLRGQRARLFVESHDGRRPLHRRTIHATVDPQRHARVLRRQAGDGRADPLGVRQRRDPDIDAHLRRLRDDVAARLREMRPMLIVRPRGGSASSDSRAACQISS